MRWVSLSHGSLKNGIRESNEKKQIHSHISSFPHFEDLRNGDFDSQLAV